MNDDNNTNKDNANDDTLNNDVIKELYQDSIKGNGNEQPPEALDQIIMAAAKESINAEKQPITAETNKNNRTMWKAAASIALISPLLVWMAINISPTDMEQAEDYFPRTETQNMAPEPISAAKPKAKKDAKAKPAEISVYSSDADMNVGAEPDREEQDNITVTGSRIKRIEEAFAAKETAEESLAETEAMSDEIAVSPAVSLQRNKALLKSEFKAQKQRINQENIADPMMALEWQQLQQYIELGDKTKAQALLATMQVDWPDYDFTTLAEQVESME